ncbi:MAPEG family protein [Pseudorhodoferax sp. Leaf267]|uniref:MAPEG family protein n=1 Tax=Pseudorhodoferax sp. Leaf267 TaxID=1736316 RepID=UPI0006F552D6|nr:MAPEG family protein [Pseudorhodoferax sp. Leaf267]KQP18418.1 glutathione metabolism protein [Pseudorhodoferax sp. Leaf267]
MTSSHLTLAYWCLLAAMVLPYVTAWIAKAGAFRPDDNRSPREWAARQGGWRARAIAAQSNGFEGLPLFMAGVIAAHQFGGAQGRIDALALSYVLLRVVYISLYIRDKSSLRSLVWVLGLAVSVALFFVAR